MGGCVALPSRSKSEENEGIRVRMGAQCVLKVRCASGVGLNLVPSLLQHPTAMRHGESSCLDIPPDIQIYQISPISNPLTVFM